MIIDTSNLGLKDFGGIFAYAKSRPGAGSDSDPAETGLHPPNLWKSWLNDRLLSAKPVTAGHRALHLYCDNGIDPQFVEKLLKTAGRMKDGPPHSPVKWFASALKEELSPDSPTGRGNVFIYETDVGANAIARIWLITDRIASRKIYYARDRTCFIWSSSLSELCRVMNHLGISARLDTAFLPLYLNYLHLTADGTLFKGIDCIPPASILGVDENQISTCSYGRAELQPASRPASEIEMRLKLALEHSMDDGPQEVAGLLLSGGLDSSLLAAVGKKNNRKLHTYSVGFQNAPDELPEAEAIAASLGTLHHSFEIRTGEVETLLHEVVSALGYPVGNPSALATFSVARQARNDVGRLYSGLGSDELFGGHTKHILVQHWNWVRPLYSMMRKARFTLSRINNDFSGRPLEIGCYLDLYRFFNPTELAELLLVNPGGRNWDSYGDLTGGLFDNTVFGIDVYSWLSDGLLAMANAISAHHGLTLHTPFCSDAMLCLAAQMPFSLKVKGTRGKWILYKAAQSYLPHYVLKKKRQGFVLPMAQWLRGPLKHLIEIYLNDKTTENRGLFNPAAVRKLVSTHLRGRADLSLQLWALISLEVWQRIFIDRSD